jgi:hypothetical protein
MSRHRKIGGCQVLRPDEFAIAAGLDGDFRFYAAEEVPENTPLPVNVRVLTAIGLRLHDPDFIAQMLSFLDESGTCGGDYGKCAIGRNREQGFDDRSGKPGPA